MTMEKDKTFLDKYNMKITYSEDLHNILAMKRTYKQTMRICVILKSH